MIKKYTLLVLLFMTAYWSKAQFAGNALGFQGNNNRVQITNVPAVFYTPNTSSFTIETWLYRAGTGYGQIFHAQASSTNYAVLSLGSSSQIYFHVVKNGVTSSVATTASIPLNQWVHVAARWTASSGTAEILLNGVVQPTTNGGVYSTAANNYVIIGANTSASQNFNGQLDELRVWNIALTNCKIQANMESTIPSAQTNLVMNYNFNQGVGGGNNTALTTLNDLSGNGYNGTIMSFFMVGNFSNFVTSTANISTSGNFNTAAYAASSQTNITCNGSNNGSASVTVSGTAPFTYNWLPSGGSAATATGLGAGVYTVSVSNSCASTTKTLAITEPSAIALSAVASASSICAGKSSTLTASGTGGTGLLTYAWSSGGSASSVVVTPAGTTTYTVSATDANSCTKTSTLGVTVKSLPVVSLTSAANSTCVNGGNIALTGSPAGGTYSGTNVSGTAFTPVSSGTFTPAYSYTNSTTGCSNTATTAIVVSLCTGIEAVEGKAATVSLYPNPSTGACAIELSVPGQISISSMIGSRILVSEQLEAGTYRFDLSGEAAGIYVVSITQNGKTTLIKLVKH